MLFISNACCLFLRNLDWKWMILKTVFLCRASSIRQTVGPSVHRFCSAINQSHSNLFVILGHLSHFGDNLIIFDPVKIFVVFKVFEVKSNGSFKIMSIKSIELIKLTIKLMRLICVTVLVLLPFHCSQATIWDKFWSPVCNWVCQYRWAFGIIKVQEERKID